MGEKADRAGQWRRSSVCPNGPDCVEVATRREGVAVRDSKDPEGPVLEFTWTEWAAFLAAVRAGQFDGQD